LNSRQAEDIEETEMNKALLTIIAAGIAGTASADVISETNSAVIEWGILGTGPVTSGEATLFPSDIGVAGAVGAITDVNVTLHGGAHTWADDMEIALRSPSGSVVILMQDAGGSDDIAGDITFDDQAAAPIDDATGTFTGSGSYMVSVYDIGTSTAPAATGADLSAFNGEDANGTWSLFVFDDAGGDTGAFSGGWTLDIVTIPAPASAALLGLGGIAAIRRRR
jgi:subtilisin-like proprotein convertase family protein